MNTSKTDSPTISSSPKNNGNVSQMEDMLAPEKNDVYNDGPKTVEDLQLPLSVVSKIIKDSLPPGVIVSKESRMAMSKAASVFILYCTSCANNLVMENKRKTLRDVDILSALEEMEFGEFVPQLKGNLEGYRKSTKDKREKAKEAKAAHTASQNTPISPNTGSPMQAPPSNLTSTSGANGDSIEEETPMAE
jgi:DNA polymerase epsilon subunit 3